MRTIFPIIASLCSAKRGDSAFDPQLTTPVTNDSRLVSPGGVFIAVPGWKFDGHDYIAEAVAKGAKVVIHERDLGDYAPGVAYWKCPSSALAQGLIWREVFGRPDEEIEVLGVTGTNGKTTTAYLLQQIFDRADRPCGLISTIEYRDGKHIYPSTNTTPGSRRIYELLAQMRDNGLRAAAMELSSHALDQRRTAGLHLAAGIFTNLTGDHLDYHGSMENYYQAKRRMFTECMSPSGVAVVNVDDAYGRRLASELRDTVPVETFGCSNEAKWRIAEVKLSAEGGSFELLSAHTAIPVTSNLIGAHNVHNLSGVVVAALARGIAPERIAEALKNEVCVPGRLEAFRRGDGAVFYVDYAHTDDALDNVLATLRPLTKGRLIVVFGAGGNRDRTKRPRMGRAAAAADVLIVTSDNPRDEEPEAIIREVVAGIPAGTVFETVCDRREAIRRAGEIASSGDCVLVAGKGHEDYQEIRGVRHHFSDQEEIRGFL